MDEKFESPPMSEDLSTPDTERIQHWVKPLKAAGILTVLSAFYVFAYPALLMAIDSKSGIFDHDNQFTTAMSYTVDPLDALSNFELYSNYWEWLVDVFYE